MEMTFNYATAIIYYVYLFHISKYFNEIEFIHIATLLYEYVSISKQINKHSKTKDIC